MYAWNREACIQTNANQHHESNTRKKLRGDNFAPVPGFDIKEAEMDERFRKVPEIPDAVWQECERHFRDRNKAARQRRREWRQLRGARFHKRWSIVVLGVFWLALLAGALGASIVWNLPTYYGD